MAHMKVPDRILVAGSEQHISQKSTPRELDLDIGPLPPTADHIRVNTPPRSLKLEETAFPLVTDPPFRPKSSDSVDGHGYILLGSSSR